MSDAALIVLLIAWLALFAAGVWMVARVASATVESRVRRRAGLPPKDDTRA